MKAVVASSRLGNHGHHDCSRGGRGQGRARGLAQPGDSAGPESGPDVAVFQSDHPAVSPLAVPGAACDI